MSNYSSLTIQAFLDWTGRKAYIDNKGNYRVGTINMYGSITKSRKHAEWNKEIKNLFSNVSDFHIAAHEYIGEPAYTVR